MATDARDLYGLLEVGRDATDAELKKAFRHKARELHPDVSSAPDAEARFKEVARAYEVLSNAETRAIYDRHGEAGLRGAGRGPSVDFGDLGSFQDIFDAFFGGEGFGGRGARRGGDDVGLLVELSFVESATGVARELEYEAMGVCDTCEGTRLAPGARMERCSVCAGQGRVRQVTRGPLGQFLREQICPQCAGAGAIPSAPCPACDGRGARPTRRSRSLEIPAGIADGQQIRVPGAGHAGEHGAPAGDLYVQVGVARDERFEREGLDILTRVAIPVTDAMVGAAISVPTIEGETELELRAGIQSGDELLLRGKGFPALQGRGRGDQRVVVDVRIPKVATEEGRRAVEQLAEQLTARHYREDEGFFDRLRSVFR